ncbi:MAG: hypothetical protein PVG39_04720 [Desulfobacteraceae bacterium]
MAVEFSAPSVEPSMKTASVFDFKNQRAYKIVDELFTGFIKDNREWIDKIADGRIATIGINGGYIVTDIAGKEYEVYSTGILVVPFCVTYVGKRHFGEGEVIEFLDSSMDKIYSYYDVE